jgi:RNA polymerase subunit RPABC4/transcription elongation factor Spt4
MAEYKQTCQGCGAFIERNAKACPKCGSRSPFGYHCPECLKPISREDNTCSGCGRTLSAVCPYCGGKTFVGADNCDSCGQTLYIKCESKRCGEYQFFENKRCTACGKPIKKGAKQIEAIKTGGN